MSAQVEDLILFDLFSSKHSELLNMIPWPNPSVYYADGRADRGQGAADGGHPASDELIWTGPKRACSRCKSVSFKSRFQTLATTHLRTHHSDEDGRKLDAKEVDHAQV